MTYRISGIFVKIACLCAFSLFVQACQQSITDTPAPSPDTAASPTDLPSRPTSAGKVEIEPPAVREITYIAEKIEPRSTQLTSQNTNSKINVRSQPSTRSTAKHYGLSGDPVTLLQQAKGEGGDLWYYLRFQTSKVEGWVHSGLVAQDKPKLRSRQSYRPFNFESDPWLSSFHQDYKQAQQSKAPWLMNPQQVAKRLAGFPNPDGCEPDSVSTIESPDPNWITVLIKTGEFQGESCSGDSVSASEIRVDLIQSDQIWAIDWAGGRYRCHPGRGQQDFAPSLCS